MTSTINDRTPTRMEGPGGAYISDPKNATIVMGGSEWDGAPQIPGATLVLHAMGDRTNNSLTFAEVTFPVGQRPWFHTHHSEDEGFFILEGQLTVTVLDGDGQRHTLVTNPGELVWGPQDYAHSYHVTSDVPCKTIIALTPGSTLPAYFAAVQNLELDPNDTAAVEAFCEETNRLYGLEFLPHIPLDV
ncbi:MAG: cupin domain-containing protein [Actinomycetota bacterium]|jgi:quercetin dioxygenase-like cupin family protein|uniref:cupin domain-containing protein n=1 Tax=Rhodococcus sp. HS-D2 TaxID=1384636 RepID=UPI0007D91044|nr:cupin domain-containing protein [Rhodococcus sp. HS-D2]